MLQPADEAYPKREPSPRPEPLAEATLDYSIHKYSSYSTLYLPENILVDKPTDQASRWSSDTNNPPQYLILKLAKPAIVKTITFGKYEKTHVCSLKKFKIFGGMNDESMMELLDSGLKNDSHPEVFMLKHAIGSNYIPTRFIKIMPIQSWGPSFNFSIWYVQLAGCSDPDLVRQSIKWFNQYKQDEAIRLCLKHLRQRNYLEAFECLQKRTKVELEKEPLTTLHHLLVVAGDFAACEKLLAESCFEGRFDEYLRRQDYKPVWRPVVILDKLCRPGMRGGHQMVMDSPAEIIYLFGGWDGTQDLSDLWSFQIRTGIWTCISKDTAAEGGPTARSCHKMCLDPLRKKIFTLGRYLDSAIRSPDNLKSDFFVYDIEGNKWTLITEDTAAMGGPRLIFDHQICMDVQKNTIFVFGGRILTASNADDKGNGGENSLFSGLFTYHVPTNTWTKLRDDVPSRDPNIGITEIRSRIGHSMLFHETHRLLYIFAGQRQKEYLKDFFTYNVDTDRITVIFDGEKNEVPAAGFTQRATIDPDTNEIYVLSGLNKDKDKREESVKNSFWVYDIQQNRWSCVYRNESSCDATTGSGSSTSDKPEPCPRFAHQLVYDSTNKVHYLFGGNPGKNNLPKLRLDDFWILQLTRMGRDHLMKKCNRLIREQKYKEIIDKDKVEALRYLQEELYQTFDHTIDEESKEFQLLASQLFRDSQADVEFQDCGQQEINYINRTKVFDALVEFYPEDITQPKGNLVDLVLT